MGKHYHRRKAAGLCPDCPTPAPPGRVYCAACSERHTLLNLATREDCTLAEATQRIASRRRRTVRQKEVHL